MTIRNAIERIERMIEREKEHISFLNDKKKQAENPPWYKFKKSTKVIDELIQFNKTELEYLEERLREYQQFLKISE